MPKKLQLREINENERQELQRISRSRTEAARRVERAKIILALGDKERVVTIAERYLGISKNLLHSPVSTYFFLPFSLSNLDSEKHSCLCAQPPWPYNLLPVKVYRRRQHPLRV